MADNIKSVNADTDGGAKVVSIKAEQALLDKIDLVFKGGSRAERIKKCLLAGLESQSDKVYSSSVSANSGSVAQFYRTYRKLMDILQGSDNDKVKVINAYMLGFFTSDIPSYVTCGIDESTHNAIIRELKKYVFSISEGDKKNCISPDVVGSVIEKLVNQKEAGAYYTPQDTNSYITEYSVIFALLQKCNNPALNVQFYAQFGQPNTLSVLNSSVSPVEAFAKAVCMLSEDGKRAVFESIKSFTVVDPTCGTGAFVITAADTLVRLYRHTNMYLYISLSDFVLNIFEHCLYGVDIMEMAISLIELRCKLYLYNLGVGRNVVENIHFNFVCGDALTDLDNTPNTDDNAILPNAPQGFLWQKAFPEVFERGGFDCVIGNPPYVEMPVKSFADGYCEKFASKKCGNSFALIVEQSLNILKADAFMGMIVPISFTSTPRMERLRTHILENSEELYIANFSDRPSCLFAGVHQKLSIIFIKKTRRSSHCKVYSSPYIHWSKAERGTLFQSVKYIRTTQAFMNENGIGKIGNQTKSDVLRRVFEMPYSFADTLSDSATEECIYVNQRMTFWLKCFSNPEKSNEYKRFYINSDYNRKAVCALLNSSLFFMIWESFSDCWHITARDLNAMRFGEAFRLSQNQTKLARLQDELEQKLYSTREYIYSKQTDYIYVHRKCYAEIAAIDDAVADIFGLSQKERQYVHNYNLNYRLSITSEEAEK